MTVAADYLRHSESWLLRRGDILKARKFFAIETTMEETKA